jgi:hypothetical protein
MVSGYYSKIQQRFVSRDDYFDELLFSTIQEPFNKPIKYEEDGI